MDRQMDCPSDRMIVLTSLPSHSLSPSLSLSHTHTRVHARTAHEQDDSILQDEIAKAHVVCVVYDITQEDSLDRVNH